MSVGCLIKVLLSVSWSVCVYRVSLTCLQLSRGQLPISPLDELWWLTAAELHGSWSPVSWTTQEAICCDKTFNVKEPLLWRVDDPTHQTDKRRSHRDNWRTVGGAMSVSSVVNVNIWTDLPVFMLVCFLFCTCDQSADWQIYMCWSANCCCLLPERQVQLCLIKPWPQHSFCVDWKLKLLHQSLITLIQSDPTTAHESCCNGDSWSRVIGQWVLSDDVIEEELVYGGPEGPN